MQALCSCTDTEHIHIHRELMVLEIQSEDRTGKIYEEEKY